MLFGREIYKYLELCCYAVWKRKIQISRVMLLCCLGEKDTNISSYDVMLCGRERYKYLEL